MENKGMDKLKERFAQIPVEANPRTMKEVVAYIEEQWHAQRVKIKENDYIAHYKNALEFMESLGKDTSGVQEEIRRYALPEKNICVIVGMESEYMTAESGIKYYQAMTMVKGLTQEDIDTKNDRWLQYMMLLEMKEDWAEKEAQMKADLDILKREYELHVAELEQEKAEENNT